MKRTPLKRKTGLKRTELKRTGGGLKRTPLKRESSKSKARREEATPWRRQRVKQFPVCWICVCRKTNEIHEIARGSRSRHKAIDKPYATLPVCRKCHDEKLGDTKEWSEPRQLALVLMNDPAGYDLAAYNELVGFGPDRITQSEVDEWLTKKWW